MSYPDLGCFAECLTCELCKEGLGLPPYQPDLFPDSLPEDGDPLDLDGWEPPPDDDDKGLLDDLEAPPLMPWVDLDEGIFGFKYSGTF